VGYGLDKSPWAGANFAVMGYLVAHFRKVKTTGGLGSVADHNSRANVLDKTGGWIDKENLPPWLTHPERIEHNEGHADERAGSIQKMWHRAIKEADLKRKPQKNAAAAVEAVFSASRGSFKVSDWKAYFRDCREWVDKKFGHENVLQWNTHFDETTPHMHVLLIPIVRDPDRGNKYSSGHFLGGRDGLREIQTELYEMVGKKYGLERGLEGSDARHTNQEEWKRELFRKEKELKKREEDVSLTEAKIREARERMLELIKETPENIQALLKNPDALRTYADEREKKILDQQKAIQQNRHGRSRQC
jgi:hypothetical protein